uniref:choline-phosphate cytidylyltransferase n=1 Tax=Psilocybe cubensis TaxID=181762 RepID=A0A8H7XTB3_PSICU
MDSSNVLSDDEYDVISNPGSRSLESSIADFHFEAREPPAFRDAQERFETTRWTASEIQLYVRKGLGLSDSIQATSFDNKRIRIYVDGIFDGLDVSDALKLRQAKLAFPSVHLMVGVFSDQALQMHNHSSNRPEIERAELVRHCRWIDEVVKDAPWELTPKFLTDKSIDFVAIDEGTSIDPNCDKARVLAYDELKKHGS